MRSWGIKAGKQVFGRGVCLLLASACLLLGGCSLVVGFVMLLLPKESLAAFTALFGFSLILNGIERLLTTLFCSRYLRKLHKNMQDVIHDDAPPRVK